MGLSQPPLESSRPPCDPVSGRTRTLYSIYEEMAERGREFNEIYDLNALDVLVQRDGKEGERDCYGAVGVVHSLWKPMPGRFRDHMAMPRLDIDRSLHTTVIGRRESRSRFKCARARRAGAGRTRIRSRSPNGGRRPQGGS